MNRDLLAIFDIFAAFLAVIFVAMLVCFLEYRDSRKREAKTWRTGLFEDSIERRLEGGYVAIVQPSGDSIPFAWLLCHEDGLHVAEGTAYSMPEAKIAVIERYEAELEKEAFVSRTIEENRS